MSNRFVACGIAAFGLLIAVIASISVMTSTLQTTLFNLRDFWVFSGMKTMKTPED